MRTTGIAELVFKDCRRPLRSRVAQKVGVPKADEVCVAFTPTQAPSLPPAISLRKTNWFLVLFAIPFIAIGLKTIWLGLSGLFGEDPGSQGAMQLVSGFIFAAAGSFTLWASVRQGRGKQLRAVLQARHPTEPWRWRADWNSGRIPSSSGFAALGLVFFAVVWNVLCIPMLWSVPSHDAPFAWLFVIVGAAIAIFAGLIARRWFRFGRSVFESTRLPGRLGDRLRGTIHLRGRLLPQKGFRAT